MRSSLEAAGALSSSSSSEIQSYNLFLPYAKENWLCHTSQLCRTSHPRIWDLWKRLVTGEMNTVQLPWSPEDCIDLVPAFIDFTLKSHNWNLIFIFIGRAKGSALSNLKPIYDIIKLQAEGQDYSLAKSEEVRLLVRLLDPILGAERADPVVNLKNSPALHAAAYKGFVECVQWLLDNGAAINLRGGELDTALQAACSRNEEEVVKLLLDNEAEVNLQGGKFGTALTAACYVGNEMIVKLLIVSGADPNLQSGRYNTALQAASIQGHEVIVKLLLEKGADVKLYGGFCGTALVAASTWGHLSIVKLLLENDADVNLQVDPNGTPLEAAQRNSRHEIVTLLLEHGAIKKRFLVF
jgi:hypothetical protein